MRSGGSAGYASPRRGPGARARRPEHGACGRARQRASTRRRTRQKACRSERGRDGGKGETGVAHSACRKRNTGPPMHGRGTNFHREDLRNPRRPASRIRRSPCPPGRSRCSRRASPRASSCAHPRTGPPSACAAVDVGALEDLADEGAARAPAAARRAPAPRSNSAAERAWSVARDAGRVGRHVRQHDVERRQRPQQLGVGRGEDVAAQDARARRSAAGSGSRSIPTTAPCGPTTVERVLQPRAGPAAEIQHPVAGAQQAQPAVDLLELVDRARREAGAARLLEEGVVPVLRLPSFDTSAAVTSWRAWRRPRRPRPSSRPSSGSSTRPL